VGQTTQLIEKRFNQHLQQSNSQVKQHLLATGHSINIEDNLQILDSQSNELELLISESKIIRKYAPELNVNYGIKLMLT